MRPTPALLAVVLSSGLSSGGAHADAPHDPLTLDRLTPRSSVGLDLGVGLWSSAGATLAAHYVHRSGLGGYAALPISTTTIDGQRETALGNAEAGALYARGGIVAHAGFAYDYEHQGIAPSQVLAAVARYGDLVHRWPMTSWLRVGASAMGERGTLFWRADLGLDVMVDDHAGMGEPLGPILRGGAAGGVDLGRGEVSVELIAMVADGASGTIAIGGRLHAGRVTPGLAVIVPTRSSLEPTIAASVTVALR